MKEKDKKEKLINLLLSEDSESRLLGQNIYRESRREEQLDSDLKLAYSNSLLIGKPIFKQIYDQNENPHLYDQELSEITLTELIKELNGIK